MSKHKHERGQSLFGPIILIGVGVFFLLRNLNIVPEANLAILFRVWPLWLIFLGVNIVVQQAPKRVAGLLSGLVGMTAVFTATFLVFFSEDNVLLNRLGVRPAQMEVISETVSYDPDGINRADISLEFGSRGGSIYALEPAGDLIRGDVSHNDNLLFRTEAEDGTATVFLGQGAIAPWQWFTSGGGQPWVIGLNPDTPLDLNIDSGSGSVAFELEALTLENLRVDLGSGSSSLTLPGGDYPLYVDVGSGSTRLIFQGDGRIQSDINGGSGSMVVALPAGLPARIEIEDGSGSVSLPRSFELVDGQRGGDSIWETAEYSRDGSGIDMYIDVGSGSVSIQQEAGGR